MVILLYPILVITLRRQTIVVIGLSLLSIFLIGYFLASYKMISNRTISFSVDSEPVFVCNGIVMGEPRRKIWGSTVDIDLRGCKNKWEKKYAVSYGGVRVSTRQKDLSLIDGDHVRFMAKYRDPPDIDNFSYKRYLLVHGIAATGWVYGKVYIEETSSSYFRKYFHDLRRRISYSMPQDIPEERTAIIESLAIGKRDGITSAMRGYFSASGLSHILAISGLHVGLIALMIYLVSKMIFGFSSRLLLSIPLQIVASIIMLPIVWGYVFLTQCSMSSIRAAIMISIFMMGVIIKRRQNLINTLSIAVIIILITMPLSVLDVSFQLSVTAVLGILLLGYPIVQRLNLHFDGRSMSKRVGRNIVSVTAITFSATVFTLPLVAYHFHMVTMLGLISNLIAVPLVSILLVPSIFIASIISLFSAALSYPMWIVSSSLTGLFIGFAKMISTSGGIFVFQYVPSIYEVILIYIGLVLAIFWKRVLLNRGRG
ncbi:MAG: DUF4131 domain-containing protein [Deltaproteobacteria bacterium]|nr:DUF4131 domain-containing protein [Deltaproteobacteria bacterium]